ncbi:FAD-dependent oxidoreductase [Nesterenkonia aurantiaca]|uniref:Sarcosine oxidase n=1 Tax=Nesterenkonia aurantiaca TaxID=1436010 RepID=A0A4R7G814_9MICC|nr:FAD-dependent oxidoreductase [Nesterenkonia aurantiaca]TDS87773.1 sarcosine oxidase [Nesterenkonia aurantiaca]
MHTSRYAVIGAGLAGASAAWQLATAGHDVTILEQQGSPAGSMGSSHGSARIFRYPYPDQHYVALVRRSASLWAELETQLGQKLITPTGGVDFGERRNPELLARILEKEGIENEVLSCSQAEERWPQLAFDSSVLWQPQAGVIDAERTVEGMVQLAVAAGAEVKLSWKVQAVTRSTQGYRIRSGSGETVEAERVVVAAGGWLPELLAAVDLPEAFLKSLPQFQVRQEQAYHFPYRDPTVSWPVLVHKTDAIQTYGLPGGRDADFRGHKLAEYNGGKVLPSAAQQDGVVDEANRRRVIAYAARHLPGVVPEPYAETTCLFTSTPTDDFVFDRCEGITVVSPCSGHGAKFAPLIGVLAAAAASAASDDAGRAVLPERFLTPWSTH